jgi:hypothetical protein
MASQWSRTIRIDNDVYAWLKTFAIPLKDTPNMVLRRIARLDPPISPNLPDSVKRKRKKGAK